MTIRQAEVSDAVTLATLNATVQALHVQGNSSFFRETTIEQVAEWFTERLRCLGFEAQVVQFARSL